VKGDLFFQWEVGNLNSKRMKKLVAGILIIASSCVMQSNEKKNSSSESGLSDTRTSSAIGDSIIHITLKSGIEFNWTNKEKQIVEDTFYNYIKNNFKKLKGQITSQIVDTTKTSAIACNAENLLIGDIVFILLNKIVFMPNVIDMQLDVFEKDCKFPVGYFNAINRDRVKIKERINEFLNR
jgi:hypothetical protein